MSEMWYLYDVDPRVSTEEFVGGGFVATNLQYQRTGMTFGLTRFEKGDEFDRLQARKEVGFPKAHGHVPEIVSPSGHSSEVQHECVPCPGRRQP